MSAGSSGAVNVPMKTLFIEPSIHWGNSCVKSFNDKIRDELLDRELFELLEEKALVLHPLRTFGYQLPALEIFQPCSAPPNYLDLADLSPQPALS
jgi:putative transposase